MKKLLIVLILFFGIAGVALGADVSINDQNELAAAPAENDILAIYDVTGVAGMRITALNFLNALEAALTDYAIHADNLPDLSATYEPADAAIVKSDEAEVISANWDFTANPHAVNEGGTGAATFTDGGILLGSGTGAITALGAAANGEIPIGDGTTDPVLANITGTANEITVTNGAGTIALSLASVIVDNFTEGITQLESINADATPDITNGTTTIVKVVESNANGTITDFDDGDDHSEFTTGDWFIFRMTDASTTIDFSGNANIEGNAGTDYTGSASDLTELLFRFQGTYWQCINLMGGFSDPLTFASKVVMKVTAISGNDTLTSAEQYNGRVFVSAASVVNAAGVAEGMEVVIVSHTDSDVDFNPDDADQISLNGAAADTAGDAVRLTNTGEILTCTGISASVWNCVSDAGVAQ